MHVRSICEHCSQYKWVSQNDRNPYNEAMSGRREHLRTSLMASIRDASLAELREVANVAGISPSGLYRYVQGRDGLLELLIADGFERFGLAIGAAIDAAQDDFASRVDALAVAYRHWAFTNPEQFALILGSPIAGFRSDPGGPTDLAARRFGMPMLAVFANASKAGELVDLDSDATTHIDLTSFDPSIGPVPAMVVDVAMRSWARIHGLVILEAYGHLTWTGRDITALLHAETASIVTSFLRSPSTV
jgi:AcrR family transcriptional regulator